MAEIKSDSVVVDMERGNDKEVINQNYTWSLGELVETGGGNTGLGTMDLNGSCETETTTVMKRKENLSIFSKFYGFRKAAYHILRVRRLTTTAQIRPYGVNNLPALLPNLAESTSSDEKKEEIRCDPKEKLFYSSKTSEVNSLLSHGEDNIELHQQPGPPTFSAPDAVEYLKKRMEARVHQVSLEAGQPKLLFIPVYMDFLSKLGLRPMSSPTTKDKIKCFWMLQMALFWINAATSCLNAALDTKDSWLIFRVKRDLLQFITFGFFVVNLFATVKLIKCFIKSRDTDALERCASRSLTIGQCFGWKLNKNANVVHLLISTSLMMTFAVVVFGTLNQHDWSIRNMQLVHAYKLSHDLFIWRPRDLHNGTETYLEERFGTNLTSETICFATFGNMLSFIGSLHANAIVDLFLVVSLEVHQIQVKLSSDLEMTKLSVRDAEAEFRINWTLYTQARDTCEKLNEIFGGLVKIVHVKTMFEISYLLVQILTKKHVTVQFLVDICNAIKVASAYRFLKKCAEKNDKLEEFVTQYSQNRAEIGIEGKQISVTLLLRGMKKRRIGLGRGEFFVDEAFVLKMASGIGAVFTLLMDQLDKKDC